MRVEEIGLPSSLVTVAGDSTRRPRERPNCLSISTVPAPPWPKRKFSPTTTASAPTGGETSISAKRSARMRANALVKGTTSSSSTPSRSMSWRLEGDVRQHRGAQLRAEDGDRLRLEGERHRRQAALAGDLDRPPDDGLVARRAPRRRSRSRPRAAARRGEGRRATGSASRGVLEHHRGPQRPPVGTGDGDQPPVGRPGRPARGAPGPARHRPPVRHAAISRRSGRAPGRWASAVSRGRAPPVGADLVRRHGIVHGQAARRPCGAGR